MTVSMKTAVATTIDTSTDKLINGCYHLLVIWQLILNYSTLNKQLNGPDRVNEAFDDENIIIDVTLKLYGIAQMQADSE
ncbi:hypothetical protein TIFTF001_033848 [Ficus carica]|uniref:Uncharacterized protein n=1 Tax=Ficus carica TaxID=3494 RepID=A0AA88J8E3_FICCA|nr:hypothetical protein TIFTF001_033848 [Ficus carica]